MVDNSLVLAAFGIFFSFEDGASISLIFINCLGEINRSRVNIHFDPPKNATKRIVTDPGTVEGP